MRHFVARSYVIAASEKAALDFVFDGAVARSRFVADFWRTSRSFTSLFDDYLSCKETGAKVVTDDDDAEDGEWLCTHAKFCLPGGSLLFQRTQWRSRVLNCKL